jgi:hypothetical protein
VILRCAASMALLVVLAKPAPAAAQAGALLSVSSTTAGASLFVDGALVGTTPLVGVPLAAGRHHLVLKASPPTSPQPPLMDREIDLSEGETLSLEVPPSPANPSPPKPPAAIALPVPPVVPVTHVSHPWFGVPWPTWIAGGVAAGLFGVGLGFGVAAGNIDHMAGVNVSPSGVDLGLTRGTAVAGRTDATVGNVLMVSAGVVTLVGLAFAALAPDPHANDPQPAPAPVAK